MTATIISIDEARSRLRGFTEPVRPVATGAAEVSYDAAMQAAWQMLDQGEVGAHEFLELCREAMAQG